MLAVASCGCIHYNNVESEIESSRQKLCEESWEVPVIYVWFNNNFWWRALNIYMNPISKLECGQNQSVVFLYRSKDEKMTAGCNFPSKFFTIFLLMY